MDFKDKYILITGACSGIGKIMARKALERQAKALIILDINETGLNETKQVFAGFNVPIHTYQVNLNDPEQVKQAAQKIKTDVQQVDGIINNAGVVTGKYFHEHTHEQIGSTLTVNAASPMHLVLEFLPGMMQRNMGFICNIASSAGLIANPKMSVYVGSKWAITGWSDSLRLEMKQLQKNIKVTTIMPFYISTGMFDGVKSKVLPILKPEYASEKIMRSIEQEKGLVAMPMSYGMIRFWQGILPVPAFEWMMDRVFGIYDTMKNFKGRT